jgi:ParB family chromosome partitioning protein
MQKNKKSVGIGRASKKRKKMALGRGLDALIPDFESIESKPKDFFQCDIGQIRPNRYQPRRRFAEHELKELSSSIKEQGILQPLLVKKEENGFELIAGERRLRAAKMAGLNQVPVIIKDIPDTKILELSIVENIQRQNLNPIEEAEAYYRLMTEFGLTQDQTAQRVGKSRSAVANFLRLRQLPEEVKTGLIESTLSTGHARALLGAESPAQQRRIYRAVLAKGLSVRQTETLINRLKSEKKKAPPSGAGQTDRHLLNLSEELSRKFGTKIQIKRKGQKGTVEIEFYDDNDLDRLINIFNQIH